MADEENPFRGITCDLRLSTSSNGILGRFLGKGGGGARPTDSLPLYPPLLIKIGLDRHFKIYFFSLLLLCCCKTIHQLSQEVR